MTSEHRCDRKPRLFLSYGRKDATELALKLRERLSAQFDVWQDSEKIRAGYRWDEEVAAAIEGADAFLALLTPHAVRSAADGEDGRTSVCLDEIAHARSHETPIVPVKAAPCGVPFHIQRLHYLDGREWSASEHAFDALVTRIGESLDNVLCGNPHPLRDWAGLPEPLDFSVFLTERHAHFSGRAHVFAAFDAWLAADAPRTFLVIGSAGAGKSAIVADLVHRNPSGAVLAHHVCQWDTPITLDPARFVSSIAAQIADELPEYAAMIEDEALRRQLRPGQIEKDPASAFELCVLAPLHRCAAPPAGRLLVIDALDEGIGRAAQANILDLLVSRISRFPGWFRIAATSRAERLVTDRLGAAELMDLDAAEASNRDDVSAYVQARLSEPVMAGKLHDQRQIATTASEDITRIAGGSFLVARLLIDALRDTDRFPGTLKGMPTGLTTAFTLYFDRVFETRNLDVDAIRPLLEALATAQATVSRGDLALATGLHPKAALPRLLEALAPFFPFHAGGYSSFHQSLSDWLTDWNEETDLAVAGNYHADPATGHGLWADGVWPVVTGNPAAASDYAMRELPLHLCEADKIPDLWALMHDEAYLQEIQRRFPGEPDLPIGLARHAIRHAFRSGDIPRLGRALWHEAPRLIALAKRETPLDALDSGDLERALRLADLDNPQASVLHHIVLAWELAAAGRNDEAEDILVRLLEIDPVALDHEEAVSAILAFADIAKAGVPLEDRLLDSVLGLSAPHRSLDIPRLNFELLWSSGHRDLARRIAALGLYPDAEGAGLVAIEAIEQARSGDFEAAYETFNGMRRFDRKDRRGMSAIAVAHPFTVTGIAVAHAEQNDDANALKLLAWLNPADWGHAVAAIGEAMARSGRRDAAGLHFSDAAKQIDKRSGETSKHILEAWWSELACAQARSGFIEGAGQTLDKLGAGPDRDKALAALAMALAAGGEDERAITTLTEVEGRIAPGVSDMVARIAEDRGTEAALAVLDQIQLERYLREDVYEKAAAHLAEHGRFGEAEDLASHIANPWILGHAFQRIAAARAKSGNLADALRIANACAPWRRKRAFLEIGAALAERGDGRRAREQIAHGLALESDEPAVHRDAVLQALLERLADGKDIATAEAVAKKISDPFKKTLARATLARAQHLNGSAEAAKAEWAALCEQAPETPKDGKILIWQLAQDQLDCGETDLAMANTVWLEGRGGGGFYFSEYARQAARLGHPRLALAAMDQAVEAIGDSGKDLHVKLPDLLRAVTFLEGVGARDRAIGIARGEKTEIGRGALLATIAEVLAEADETEIAGELIDEAGVLLQPVADLEQEFHAMLRSAPRGEDDDARAQWETELAQVKARLDAFRPAKTVEFIDHAVAIKAAELARARTLARLRRTEQARAVAGNQTTKPFRAEVLVSAAEGAAGAGQPEEALSFLDAALEALRQDDAPDPQRLQELAGSFLRIGSHDRAADCLALSPNAETSAALRIAFAQAAQREGDDEAARRHFADAFAASMAIGDGRDRSRALGDLAVRQAESGFPEAALGIARAIAEDRATRLPRLFRTYVALGRRDEAGGVLLLCAADSAASREVLGDIVVAFPDRLGEIAACAIDEL